jgi:hypothetical protein
MFTGTSGVPIMNDVLAASCRANCMPRRSFLFSSSAPMDGFDTDYGVWRLVWAAAWGHPQASAPLVGRVLLRQAQ